MINTKLNPQFVTLNYVIWVILTGTGTGTSQTISNTISSKGSNISTTSQFSAASGDEAYPNGQILPTANLRIFSFTELKVAIKNFSPDTILGEGGFGQVFKGWLKHKRQSKSGNITTTKNVYYNKKKNRCNNIEIIAIVYAKCCNKIWGNKIVLQKNFVAINLEYFNENFDVIICLLLQ